MWTCSKCGYNTEDDQIQFCGRCGNKCISGEATAFDVVLVGFDPAKKINVIKNVRELTGAGLKEAKDFVESPPRIIGYVLTRHNAESLSIRLNSAGAFCEIHPQNAGGVTQAIGVNPVQNDSFLNGNVASASSEIPSPSSGRRCPKCNIEVPEGTIACQSCAAIVPLSPIPSTVTKQSGCLGSVITVLSVAGLIIMILHSV